MKYYILIGQLCVVHNYRAPDYACVSLVVANLSLLYMCTSLHYTCLSGLRLDGHYFQSGMYKSHDVHSVLCVSHDDQPLLGIHIRATYTIISLQISLQNK